MSKMEIHVPKEIEDIEGDLRYFIDSMIRKMHVNRHKGFIENSTLKELRGRVYEEFSELDEALRSESQFDVVLECVDVANTAFLLGLAALLMDKKSFNESRITGQDLIDTGSRQ